MIKYLLGMFKNLRHVQNKIRLHVKYLLNVKSLKIIWSSFLLLLLIKNAIKNAATAVISSYMVGIEILKIKILKFRQKQVKLVLEWKSYHLNFNLLYIYIYNYGSTHTYTKLKIYSQQTPKYSKGIWEWKEN